MKLQRKATAPIRVRAAAKNNINPINFSDSSRSAQRARLLERLRQGALTSIDVRHCLDILHPAGRVSELRERGFDIQTTYVYQPTDGGRFHRVGLYTLVPHRYERRYDKHQ